MKKKVRKEYKNTPKKAKDFLKLFVGNMCDVTKTCVAIGISRQTYYNWIDYVDDFAEKIDDEKESLYDRVESKMFEKAFGGKGNGEMLKHISQAKMADRGYRPKNEIEVVGNPFLELMKRATAIENQKTENE